jgi:hypothetical protein
MANYLIALVCKGKADFFTVLKVLAARVALEPFISKITSDFPKFLVECEHINGNMRNVKRGGSGFNNLRHAHC